MKRWSDLGKDIEKIMAAPKDTVRKVCIEAATNIIMRTAVDKGTARLNWQASLGSPMSGIVAGADKSGQIAIQAATRQAMQAPGTIFFLTNNLPYILPLEFGLYSQGAGASQKTTRDGYSVQSANGMVRVTVEEIKRGIR